MRSFLNLLAHDLAMAWKSKTVLLIVGIPLLVYATLATVDPAGARGVPLEVALLRTAVYEPAIRAGLAAAPGQVALRWAASEQEAQAWLHRREVAGVLAPAGDGAAGLQLTVLQPAAPETLVLRARLADLQTAAEGGRSEWVTSVRAKETSALARQTLPTWVLMMILLIGFIVLPAQVAEEKEKQLLLGWMQTPVREGGWLAAKLAYALVLVLVAVATLHATSREPVGAAGAGYLALLAAGAFCFGALGVTLGLLCRGAASARALGVLCYLPLLLPAALSDLSPALRRAAVIVPSYQLYQPLRAVLVEDGAPSACFGSCLSLLVTGALAGLVAHQLLRRRWLM